MTDIEQIAEGRVNEQPCIWQRRAEAMLPLVNAAMGIADRCKMSGSRGDFIILDFQTVRRMIQVADEYRTRQVGSATATGDHRRLGLR